MPTNAQVTDTVRASRDGHRFHEAWTARKAMQLLLPMDGPIGIAVEGLSEEDQARASQGTVEIADLTVYYGNDSTFRDANRVETLQLKYSPKRAEKPFRGSDAKKTIEKFAESYRDYKKSYGAARVTKKLFFELITNRPIYPPLQQAVDGIAQRRQLTGDAKTQAEQFQKASGLTGRPLKEFASKCRIIGLAGSLRGTEMDIWKILVDWSATTDARAAARLGAMRDLVAKKAGYDSRYHKVIRQMDVLDALGLSDVAELLPCPESLASVGPIVDREQLAEIALLVPQLSWPLIVHADGGVGKTVFLQSLASLLSQQYEVVLFDCFGGGAYRSPEDGRHLPNRGLVHITNMLACRGLCDPILPGSENTEMLLGRFRKRLTQCVQTLATASPNRELVLFIDAVDNAEEYARERGQHAFPTLLLEGIYRSGPIPGVTVIASGRSHRIKKYISNILYRDFELNSFTNSETASYLSARIADITETEINVAQSRSKGNARILEHFVASDRGLLDASELDRPITLGHLLNERIELALGAARKQGYQEKEINAFLAGLSVLPPPVPLDEYAGAHGMDIGAIRSFAADLAPLLDYTPQGMTFRDEPTETHVRENYGADTEALNQVAGNLLSRQADSVYAAQTLPGLLQMLGEGEKLFNLAFDESFPATITSTVGKRRIRYARLEAAVLHASNASDNNNLVRLLVELSTIAVSDQRGTRYILDNPDLVVNAKDVDALRRLFEARTSWAGSRHARLTIASVLSGDMDDASRYFTSALNWIRHNVESVADNEYDRPSPEHIDRAAIPFFRIAEGKHRQAIGFMRMWYPWYAFEICEVLFELSLQASRRDRKLRQPVDAFLDSLTNEIGPLAGGLSFFGLGQQKKRELLRKLGKACKRATKLKTGESHSSGRSHELSDGLRKAATIAASLGMTDEAGRISLRVPHQRPRIWSMVDPHSDRDLFPHLFHVALRAAVSGTELYGRDILPSELFPMAKRLTRSLPHDQLKQELKTRLHTQIKREKKLQDHERHFSDEFRRNTDRFLDYRLGPLLELTRALASLLGATFRQADRPFQELIRVWANVRTNREGYYYELQFNQFFQLLGSRMAIFALWARSDLKATSVRFFLRHLHQQNCLPPSTLIEVIAIAARRPRFEFLAGEQAVRARTLIEREDDVTTRSELFAKLARAILPASFRDATVYFRDGLEQLDAIGSGDYEFTNELLQFASSIKGDELSEEHFHTLTNIFELNMSYEPEKFPWGTFATAMSKTSGLRGLAKLSRWHDRSKVNLEFTLLPYLTALLRDGKLLPEYALALNRLADPAELWACNTEVFASTIHKKRFSNADVLIGDLIRQYEENSSHSSSAKTLRNLAVIAGDVLGKRHSTTRHLSRASRYELSVSRDLNEQSNYYPSNNRRPEKVTHSNRKKTCQVRNIAAKTIPLNENSLRGAIDRLRDSVFSREHEQDFFRRLRVRVRVAERSSYIRLIARLEHLDVYAKFRELEECKTAWSKSSADLDTLYRDLTMPILEIHAKDFVDFGGVSTFRLNEVSELTGVSVPELTLRLLRVFCLSDWTVPASAWLGLACIVCGDADEGQGQKALGALLDSGSAKLTSTVVDGPWKADLYPANEMSAVSSGLVWALLGSPRAADRWRAAHSVRCFARMGRWEIIDALTQKLSSVDAKPFAAPELPFYYLHARLWLLMALARIALGSPAELAKHHRSFVKIALGRSHPHIVIRHFAAQIVLTCEKAGAISLSKKKREKLRTINDSPFPRRSNQERRYGHEDFYGGRPDDVGKRDRTFTLDYDFDKYNVHNLAHIFDQPGWSVRDLVSDEAHRLDPSVTSMYDKGGREMPYRRGGVGLTSGFHTYGQYLAWHALPFVAARLLSHHPVAQIWEHGDGWSDWLSYRLLTRTDGLWLSDGMDRPPLRVKANVLEKEKEGLVLTGDRDELMSLVGIDSRIVGREFVVEGDWKSPDGIGVHISSSLVDRRKGRKLAKNLVEEDDAFSIWLPTLEHDDDEYNRSLTQRQEYKPWIVSPVIEGVELERHDPLGVISVERRPRFVAEIADHYSLRPGDPFQRSWLMPGKRLAASTVAWGLEKPHENGEESGVQLVCRTKFLSSILEWKGADLVVLIKLRRYEEGSRLNRGSKFSHTVAVLRVKSDLKFEYFAGSVNQVKQLEY